MHGIIAWKVVFIFLLNEIGKVLLLSEIGDYNFIEVDETRIFSLRCTVISS